MNKGAFKNNTCLIFLLLVASMLGGCKSDPPEKAELTGKWEGRLFSEDYRRYPQLKGKDITLELRADGGFAFANLPRLGTDNTISFYSGNGDSWEVEDGDGVRLYLNAAKPKNDPYRVPGQRYSAIHGDICVEKHKGKYALAYIWGDADSLDFIEFEKVSMSEQAGGESLSETVEIYVVESDPVGAGSDMEMWVPTNDQKWRAIGSAKVISVRWKVSGLAAAKISRRRICDGVGCSGNERSDTG